MVDYNGNVLVTFLVRSFVDSDLDQTIKSVLNDERGIDFRVFNLHIFYNHTVDASHKFRYT